MTMFLLAIGLVALAVLMIAIRMIFLKNGEFRGTCSSNNPLLRNEIGQCTICGSKPGEECRADQATTHSDSSTIASAKP